MPKKSVHHKHKAVNHEHHYHENSALQQREIKVDPLLIENFVSLQRVLTNLSLKLDNLTGQVSKLLDLFEISAKALAEKDFDLESGNKDFIDKLDSLVDQNKTLARGLSLLHERIPPQEMFMQPMPQQMPPQYMSSQQYMQSQIPQQRELPLLPKKQKPLLTKTRELNEFTQEASSSNQGSDEDTAFP
ncbi:MAG: hypothetical protein AABW50_04905 [Nanoarchaeota archaeon]